MEPPSALHASFIFSFCEVCQAELRRRATALEIARPQMWGGVDNNHPVTCWPVVCGSSPRGHSFKEQSWPV